MQKNHHKERSAWMAKLRRELRTLNNKPGHFGSEVFEAGMTFAIDSLSAWGKLRVERYNKRKGGLGK